MPLAIWDPRTTLAGRVPDDHDVRGVRAVEADAETGGFSGHASVFWSVDDHTTAFAPKAFKRTVAQKGERLALHYFHDRGAVVGPIRSLGEDKTGLAFEAKAVEDGSWGSYVLAHLRAGNHLGMSFGFRTLADRPATDDDPLDLSTAPADLRRGDVRVITGVELYELSVLPWAFASQPKAGVRDVRQATAAFLSSLLDAIRDGTLDPEQRAVVEQLVDACDDGPGPGGNGANGACGLNGPKALRNGPKALRAPESGHSTPAEARLAESPLNGPKALENGPKALEDESFALLAALASERLRLTLAEMQA